MIQFNARRDRIYAHRHPDLDKVLHIIHASWHGIRSATAACPGMKITIPHDRMLDGESIHHTYGIIYKYGIKKIIFQGYSDTADNLAANIKRNFGDSVDLYAITHVNSSQFEYHFEIYMQDMILSRFNRGVFRRLGSVKPDFCSVVSGYWPKTIINYAPNLGPIMDVESFDLDAIFIPLENTWRKNLYTNILAAVSLPDVKTVYTVNWPTELERIAVLSKVRLLNYQRGLDLFATMSGVSVVLAATLAECQPMTQLEAFAAGTPSLTGQLGLDEFASHEITKLCEVDSVDNPRAIASALSRLTELRRSDPHAIRQMLQDYLTIRHDIAHRRYLDFLEI